MLSGGCQLRLRSEYSPGPLSLRQSPEPRDPSPAQAQHKHKHGIPNLAMPGCTHVPILSVIFGHMTSATTPSALRVHSLHMSHVPPDISAPALDGCSSRRQSIPPAATAQLPMTANDHDRDAQRWDVLQACLCERRYHDYARAAVGCDVACDVALTVMADIERSSRS